MEKKQLQFGPINRTHYTKPSDEQIMRICDEYLLHDLVIEDMMESFTQDKIDVYDDHLFLVVHFPKYSLLQKKYILNEFNLVIKQDSLISFCGQQTSEIAKIAELCKGMMEESLGDEDEKHIVSPYFIVYRLLDGMYSKALLSLRKLTKDLIKLEEEIFDTDHLHKELLEELMIKRRNIIVMKHTFISHDEIIEQLHQETVKLFEGELDVYFEDLQYKVDRINHQIQGLTENITSMSDTYNTLMSMRTNTIVGRLTTFTVIVGVLTLVTGFYGMNVPLPGATSDVSFGIIALIILVMSMIMYTFFKYKKRM